MKVICFFIGLCVVVSSSEKKCNSIADCNENECCLGRTLKEVFGEGICHRKSKESERCRTKGEYHEYSGDKSISYCPCESGLHCAREAGDSPHKICWKRPGSGNRKERKHHKIVHTSRKKGIKCKTEDDCSKDECCVANTIAEMFDTGICSPKAKLHQYCSKRETRSDYYGKKYVEFCPCEEGHCKTWKDEDYYTKCTPSK